MKKTLLLFITLCVSATFSIAQQVPRNLVVLEIGTGTWCPFCPSASNGADDLLENGYSVAVIKYHSGDVFANVYSQSRVAYYNISGFPTAFFDGMAPISGGGGASQTMFPQYSARVNQRMAVNSSFTIDVEGSHTCLTDFTAQVTLNKVATNNSSNLRLHAVLTEKNIPYPWQGLQEVNHACRMMVPNQFGTLVSFAGGNTQEHSLAFNVDPEWVFENLELVVFLQDQSTREIFQGTKIMLSDFLPEYDWDAGVSLIDSLPLASCNGIVEPKVNIMNYGSQTITSLDIYYHVNNGPAQSFAWTGSIDYLEQASVVLPAIDFIVEEENELVVYTMNPNSNSDECPSNDELSAIIPEAMITTQTVKLFLRTDAYPEETTWEIKNSDGEVLYSGGPYSVPNQTIMETFELVEEDCYTFGIYDSGGDGLITPGIVMLFYGNNITIYQGRDYGYGESTEFSTADPTAIPEFVSKDQIRIFPNPLKDIGMIDLHLVSDAEVEISLYNLAGQKLKNISSRHYAAGSHSISIDAGLLDPGFYLLVTKIGDEIVWQKITVVK